MVTPLHALTVVRELSARRAEPRETSLVCVWTVYKIIPALLSEFGGKLCFWDAPWDQSLSFPSYIYARAVNLVDTSDSVADRVGCT